MADYITIKNYSNVGNIGISRNCFVAITKKAIEHFEGVSIPKKGKKDAFRMNAPIQVRFKSNGQVEINLLIDVNKEENMTLICTRLQEEISAAILTYTESVPFKINIKVAMIN